MPVKPRVAFVGLGWIGRHRMEGILDLVEPVALADPSPESRAEAAKLCQQLRASCVVYKN